MTDLIALAERVEAGTGEDRALDAEVAVIGGWQKRVPTIPDPIVGLEPYWRAPAGNGYGDCPKFTSSLDAVVSLAEEMLPGWHWKIERFSDGWYVDGRPMLARPPEQRQWDASIHQASTECRARLAAILRAMSREGK